MAKRRIRGATLTINNGSVVVYYHHESTMKLPTGVTISKKKNKSNKFVEWDYKRLTLDAGVDDFQTKHLIIQGALKRANDLLEENAKEGNFLTGTELEHLLINQQRNKQIIRSALLLEMYNQFYQSKKEDLEVHGKIISLKDYTSFHNNIVDYEKVHNVSVKIKEIDTQFLKDFHKWLRLKCPKSVQTPEGIHHLKTKGNLAAKTLRKRFDIFKEFFRYLQVNKIVTDYEFLKDYSKKNLQNVTTTKVTLTVEEVYKLYDFDFGNDRLNKIKQLFVFACLTGMRWGDLQTFDARFIKNGVYQKTAQKTANSSGAKVQLPLCDTAMEILKLNGNSLKPLMKSNVHANEDIKEALKITGYFDAITNLVDKNTGENLRRYEAITMHKGRDTFITNLVGITPLTELMKYTGHTKLSTLQLYVDQTRGVNHNFVNEAFKRPKNG